MTTTSNKIVKFLVVYISEHNPLMIGFGKDRFLFIYLFLSIICLFLPYVAGFDEQIGEKRMGIYTTFVILGVISILGIQTIFFLFKKDKTKHLHKKNSKKFLNLLLDFENKRGWIAVIINTVLFPTILIVANTKGLIFANLVDEFLTACWEQYTFAIIGMTCLVNFFYFGEVTNKLSNKRFATFIFAFLFVDGFFAFCHWWVYQGEIWTIFVLACTGIFFIGLGYLSFSIGILLHLTYNIVITFTS